MTFDWSITLGAVLNAGVLLVGFVVAFTRIGGRIDLLALRLGAVEEAVNSARKTDSRIATIEERLSNHVTMLTTAQRDISDLRRGDGFIRNHSRTGIDGQYS